MSVEFQDFSVQVKEALDEKAEEFLYTAAEVLKTQAGQITPVKTSQLKGSWDYKVDLSSKEATIGSPLENAIWNEFGTGEYAANGDGRKGGWFYVDDEGKGHFTHGKHPRHTLQTAFTVKKNSIINLAKQIFGDMT